jgi:hypothetical protein
MNDRSFLGTKVIDSAELKTSVLGFWTFRKDNYFPGALPTSLEREHFKILQKQKYVISLKSDGTRYMLMLYKNKIYFIDRNFNFYERDLSFSKSLANDPDQCNFLIDGELIKDHSGKLIYLAHDCICAYSRSVRHLPLTDRYEYLRSIISGLNQESREQESQQTIELRLKKFYLFNEFSKDLITNSDHPIDGLILTPVNVEIGNQEQNTLFKFKENHTVDFKLVDENEYYNGYATINKTVPFKMMAVHKNNHVFKRLLTLNCPGFQSGDIVEFAINTKYNVYDPIKIRRDKDYPNSRRVVDKTNFNAKENITLDELIELFKEISSM